MKMPCNLLVTTCACKGQKWRYQPRDGADISVNAEDNEHIIFFEIDEQTNKISQFRKHFSMEGDGQKICDLLIYYYKETKNCDIRRDYKIMCLAESKGSSLKDAVEQIKNTFNHIKESFVDTNRYNSPIIWCAYVATNRFGSGQNLRRKEFRKQLAAIEGIRFSDMSSESDLGSFFRSCWERIESEKQTKKKKR